MNPRMSLQDRVDSYHAITGFPKSLMVSGDNRISGVWFGGNDYRVKSGYHGGYPAGYLKRVRAMFPDITNALHLFSGKVDLEAFPGKTCDINPDRNPDFVDDAQTLHGVPLEQFDAVLCDPPYTNEDADHYGTTPIRRNLVMRTLGARLRPGAFTMWLDMTWPMYRKSEFDLIGAIGILRSTNHRARFLTIYQKL